MIPTPMPYPRLKFKKTHVYLGLPGTNDVQAREVMILDTDANHQALHHFMQAGGLNLFTVHHDDILSDVRTLVTHFIQCFNQCPTYTMQTSEYLMRSENKYRHIAGDMLPEMLNYFTTLNFYLKNLAHTAQNSVADLQAFVQFCQSLQQLLITENARAADAHAYTNQEPYTRPYTFWHLLQAAVDAANERIAQLNLSTNLASLRFTPS